MTGGNNPAGSTAGAGAVGGTTVAAAGGGNTGTGRGSAGVSQVDIQAFRSEFDEHRRFWDWILKIGSVIVPVAIGIAITVAAYEINNRDDRLAKAEENIIDIYKAQRDILDQRDQKIIQGYEDTLNKEKENLEALSNEMKELRAEIRRQNEETKLKTK